MDVSEIINGVAESHVAQSLSEMRDEAKFSRWQNGERAKEQAALIVSLVVAEAMKSLEQKDMQ